MYRTTRLRKRRRDNLYSMLLTRWGMVPCFVCQQHVEEVDVSLEHITPLSKGGTDVIANLAISHRDCNSRRGNPLPGI